MKTKPEHVQPWPHRYWDFVFDELPRVCATMFPISTKREDTFVAGLSMGSMGAAKWAVYGPERVCAAVLMSGGGMDTNKNHAGSGGNMVLKEAERILMLM